MKHVNLSNTITFQETKPLQLNNVISNSSLFCFR